MAKHYLEQVLGRRISAAQAEILSLRSPVAGTLEKVTILTRDDVSSVNTFDANLNGASVFADADDRPSITSGNHSGENGGALAQAISVGDLLTIDADVVNETLEFITVVFEIEDGKFSQSTSAASTSSIAANASENISVPAGKYCVISKIETNRPARVRIYSNSAYRTADAARAIGTDPTGEHGLLLEVVTTAGNLALDLSPVAVCFDGETVRTGNLAAAVQNKDSVTGIVTITITYLVLEY